MGWLKKMNYHLSIEMSKKRESLNLVGQGGGAIRAWWRIYHPATRLAVGNSELRNARLLPVSHSSCCWQNCLHGNWPLTNSIVNTSTGCQCSWYVGRLVLQIYNSLNSLSWVLRVPSLNKTICCLYEWDSHSDSFFGRISFHEDQ